MFKKIFVLGLLTSLFIVGQCFAVTTTTKKEEPKTTPEATEQEVSSSLDIAELKSKTFLNNIKSNLETFRNEQAVYFANLRDKTKVKLGISVTEDVLQRVSSTLTPPPAPKAPGDPQTLGELETKKMDNPIDYGTLIYSTALASLFASALMFYAVLAFLVFFVIRFIFRMFI